MELSGSMTRARVFGALALFELRRRWYGRRLWIAVVIIGLAAFMLAVNRVYTAYKLRGIYP
ncbi:MAG: hypothetical protein P8Z49_06170 [Acidobacteriota bacterium]